MRTYLLIALALLALLAIDLWAAGCADSRARGEAVGTAGTVLPPGHRH